MLQLVFAILGMQLYTGAMASCSNPAILERELCVEPAPLAALGVRALGGAAVLAQAQKNLRPGARAGERSLKAYRNRLLAWCGGVLWCAALPTTASSSLDTFVYVIARPSDARGRALCSQDTRVLRSVIRRSTDRRGEGRGRMWRAWRARLWHLCWWARSATCSVRRVLSDLGDRGVF